jgi:hypothetical protein
MPSPPLNAGEARVLLLTWHGTALLPELRSPGPEVARIVVQPGFPNDVVAQSVHARPFIRFPRTLRTTRFAEKSAGWPVCSAAPCRTRPTISQPGL